MLAIQLSIYASLLILLFGMVFKALKIARMPIHLRWDLYPIPHEEGKARYGGSRYEESDWWTRPIQSSITGEVREIASEVLGIKTLFKYNRNLWFASFPLHWGLYFLIMFIGLLAFSTIFEIGGRGISSRSADTFGNLVNLFTVASGVTGWILGIAGATGLLIMRIVNAKYRRYSSIIDYFNLLLLLTLFIVGIAAWKTADKSFDSLRSSILGLITFKPIANAPTLIKIELALTAFFFAYLPFTHMTHFVGKFFTFHRVRWEDEPNTPGGMVEQDVLNALGTRVNWTAPHISVGKSWADNAQARSEGNARENE